MRGDLELPIVVGRASDVAEPGAFFTHDATGVPILVTRDHGGRVHAMLNVCRHRGTRLVEAAGGTASTFVCPLHAWTYDLCGRFGTSPISRCDGDGKDRREDSALVALASEVRHGFVWVVPSPRVARRVRASLGTWLDALDDDLAPLGLDDRVVAARETRVGTWDELREELGRRVVWLFPSSFLVLGREPIAHVVVHPLEGGDVEWVRTSLAR